MAKNDNLKDFLTDVANAIREKKGTTDLINPQDFSAEIASIKSGGGGGATSALAKAVNFRDYDGTILHSYTKDEFLALTELPPLPTREGLICQEWNWDFADAVEYVSEYGVLEVGATYITDDGKTRLYITIAAEGRMDVPLYFYQSMENGVTIDWGDGSATETLSGTGNVNTTHHYNAIGDYVISLEVATDCRTVYLGHNASSACILGSLSVYDNMLTKAELGAGIKMIGNYGFQNCRSLQFVTLPREVESTGSYIFQNCYALQFVVIPNSFLQSAYYAFNNCYSLQLVVMPSKLDSIGVDTLRNCYALQSVIIPNRVSMVYTNPFDSCYSLQSVTIPNGLSSISKYMFNKCYALRKLILPTALTEVRDYAFDYCSSLASIIFPSALTRIYARAFEYCYGMALYDFSALEAVPTLSNTNAFTNIPSDCKIIVPDALYDTWIAATNWSTYASYIIKKSEWDSQNA